jgi:hypothetical protein
MPTRKSVESQKEISILLKDYTFLSPKDYTIDKLKIGNFVRYIRNVPIPARVIRAGRIDNILEDKDNEGYIYRISIKRSNKTTYFLKLKDIENVYFYYKTKTQKELRQNSAKDFVQNMTPYERKKFNSMKEKREVVESKIEKKMLSNDFYSWFYKRHPDNEKTKLNNESKRKKNKKVIMND